MPSGSSVYIELALQCSHYTWLIILCGNMATEFSDDDKQYII